MEILKDAESGITYIRMIPKGGAKAQIAYNVVIRPESLIADFNSDNELVGVEVLDPALVTTIGPANLVAEARSQAPHIMRRKEPEKAPAAGRERTPRSGRRRRTG